jgi:hypothetical protein
MDAVERGAHVLPRRGSEDGPVAIDDRRRQRERVVEAVEQLLQLRSVEQIPEPMA